MQREVMFQHEFVEYIPDHLKEGIIYISVILAIAAHKCCCGCGNQVITPLSPTDWQLTFDGKSVSLDPSIGNWGFPCQSHYWIKRNRVKWAPRWSRKQIEAGRLQDRREKDRYYGETNTSVSPSDENRTPPRESGEESHEGLWHRAKSWWA